MSARVKVCVLVIDFRLLSFIAYLYNVTRWPYLSRSFFVRFINNLHYFICLAPLFSVHPDSPLLDFKLKKQGVKSFLLFRDRCAARHLMLSPPIGSKECVKTYASNGLEKSNSADLQTCSNAHSFSVPSINSTYSNTFCSETERKSLSANRWTCGVFILHSFCICSPL